MTRPGPPPPPTAVPIDPVEDPESRTSTASLPDGDRIHVRAIRPDDKDALQSGFQRLSRDSVYRRFFRPKSRLTDDELAYLTEVDFHTHVALGAILPDAEEQSLVGVGRYVLLEDDPAPVEGPVAELAITVGDEHQGRGLGGLLFDHLCSIARDQGIEAFVGHVMPENRPMRSLLETHGRVVDASSAADGVRMTARVDSRSAGHRLA